MASVSPSLMSTEELFTSFTGQKVAVAGLNSMVDDWPRKHHPAYERVKRVLDAAIWDLIPSKARVDALIRGDFAYFACIWWPEAELWEDVATCALLVLWIFLWDDEIDQNKGQFYDERKAAETYRERTREFTCFCLGFGTLSHPLDSYHRNIRFFQVITERLAGRLNEDQRTRLLTEVTYYVNACEKEQEARFNHRLHSVSEYIALRRGTSAVYITLSIVEPMNAFSLPSAAHAFVKKTTWRALNDVISMTNDILSLKKEVREECTISLIPALCHEMRTGNVQKAMNVAFRCIQDAMDAYWQAEARLLKRNAREGWMDERELQRYVRCCRYQVTGNLDWSLKTPRYGIVHGDGTDLIIMEL